MIRYSLDKKATGMFASPNGTYVKVAELPKLPVYQDLKAESSGQVVLKFDRPLTFNETDALHEFLVWMAQTP